MAEKTRPPSLYLRYHEDACGDIVMQDVYVPEYSLAMCTYYCCMAWNGDQDGSGFCGIQNNVDGKSYIFCIWNQGFSPDPVVPLYRGPVTLTEKSGGRRCGLKSMHFDMGWESDHWYTVVVRRWDQQSHTRLGFWVQDQATGTWTHLITMGFIEPWVSFDLIDSFFEDWRLQGHTTHHVKYRRGMKRKPDLSWCSFQSATFHLNAEYSAKNYTTSLKGRVRAGRYFSDGLTQNLEDSEPQHRSSHNEENADKNCSGQEKALQPVHVEEDEVQQSRDADEIRTPICQSGGDPEEDLVINQDALKELQIRQLGRKQQETEACQDKKPELTSSSPEEDSWLHISTESRLKPCTVSRDVPENGRGQRGEERGSQEVIFGCLDEASQDSPRQPPVSFTILSLTESQLSWCVDQHATPQFSYTIKDGDKPLVSEVDSETRSHQLDLVGVSEITLTLEDILGREVSATEDVLYTPS